MQRLNDAPILDQTEGMRDKILMAALWKINGGKIITLTSQDLKAFLDAHNGMPVLFMHGHKESIEVGIVDMTKAQKLAAHHDSITPKGKH